MQPHQSQSLDAVDALDRDRMAFESAMLKFTAEMRGVGGGRRVFKSAEQALSETADMFAPIINPWCEALGIPASSWENVRGHAFSANCMGYLRCFVNIPLVESEKRQTLIVEAKGYLDRAGKNLDALVEQGVVDLIRHSKLSDAEVAERVSDSLAASIKLLKMPMLGAVRSLKGFFGPGVEMAPQNGTELCDILLELNESCGPAAQAAYLRSVYGRSLRYHVLANGSKESMYQRFVSVPTAWYTTNLLADVLRENVIMLNALEKLGDTGGIHIAQALAGKGTIPTLRAVTEACLYAPEIAEAGLDPAVVGPIVAAVQGPEARIKLVKRLTANPEAADLGAHLSRQGILPQDIASFMLNDEVNFNQIVPRISAIARTKTFAPAAAYLLKEHKSFLCGQVPEGVLALAETCRGAEPLLMDYKKYLDRGDLLKAELALAIGMTAPDGAEVKKLRGNLQSISQAQAADLLQLNEPLLIVEELRREARKGKGDEAEQPGAKRDWRRDLESTLSRIGMGTEDISKIWAQYDAMPEEFQVRFRRIALVAPAIVPIFVEDVELHASNPHFHRAILDPRNFHAYRDRMAGGEARIGELIRALAGQPEQAIDALLREKPEPLPQKPPQIDGINPQKRDELPEDLLSRPFARIFVVGGAYRSENRQRIAGLRDDIEIVICDRNSQRGREIDEQLTSKDLVLTITRKIGHSEDEKARGLAAHAGAAWLPVNRTGVAALAEVIGQLQAAGSAN